MKILKPFINIWDGSYNVELNMFLWAIALRGIYESSLFFALLILKSLTNKKKNRPIFTSL